MVSIYIDPKWPYLGASPDGIVDCKYCGMGVCEIKCPYVYKNSTIAETAGQKNVCLKKDEFGKINLDKSNTYYYQVQAEIFIYGLAYCDFVVWTRDLFVQRILPEQEIWENALSASSEVFSKCILPEIVRKVLYTPRV